MKKKNEIKLPERLVKNLQALPETGMGYQVVDVELIGGRLVTGVTVLNSSIMLLNEIIDVAEIKDLKLSRNE